MTKKPTKKEMRRILRHHTGRMRREVHVYRDREHVNEGKADLASITGDFEIWGEALRNGDLIQPGYIWDIYCYEKDELVGNIEITLPEERGGEYTVNCFDGFDSKMVYYL